MNALRDWKWVVGSCAGVVALAIFLGWRGSSLSQRIATEEFERNLSLQLAQSEDIFREKLKSLNFEIAGVVAAEHMQGSGRDTNLSREFIDSGFAAVGLFESHGHGYELNWLVVSPTTSPSLSSEHLTSKFKEIEQHLAHAERNFFARLLDSKGSPIMAVFTKVEVADSQFPALAMAVLRPHQVNFVKNPESLLWDEIGFVWGYQNPYYIGSSLKENALIEKALSSEDVAGRLVDKNRVAAFAQLKGTNLFVGVEKTIPPVAHFILQWWVSLGIGLLGACFLSWSAFTLLRGEEPEVVAAPIHVEQFIKSPEVSSVVAKEIELTPRPEPAPEPIKRIEEDFIEETKPAVEVSQDAGTQIEPVIQRALSTLRGRCLEGDVNVQVRLHSGLRVSAKAAQLQTAVEEIIKNALDAMENASDRHLIIEGVEAGENVKISVRDTGIGIRAEIKSQIFDPFFTTRPESARGLGLTVVKRMLELVHGDVQIESEFGKGTTMTLVLPKTPSVALSVQLEPEPEDELPLKDYVPIEIRKARVRMFD